MEIKNPKQWYEKNHPNLNVGDLIPNKCLDCSQQLEVGNNVERRFCLNMTVQSDFGDRGIVSNIYDSHAGKIYEVKFIKENKSIIELCTLLEIRKC